MKKDDEIEMAIIGFGRTVQVIVKGMGENRLVVLNGREFDAPPEIATSTTSLKVGPTLADTKNFDLKGKTLPVTLTLTHETDGKSGLYWVEARDAGGAVVGTQIQEVVEGGVGGVDRDLLIA